MAMNNVGGNMFIIVQSLVVVLAIINVVNIFCLQKKRKRINLIKKNYAKMKNKLHRIIDVAAYDIKYYYKCYYASCIYIIV